jgi:hypothetical protein
MKDLKFKQQYWLVSAFLYLSPKTACVNDSSTRPNYWQRKSSSESPTLGFAEVNLL